MNAMRALLAVVLFLSLPCARAQSDGSFAITEQFARAGMPQLVLDRIRQYQPSDTAAAAWAQWEALRCEALAALGRHRELTERIASFPGKVSARPLAGCLLAGMRAALALEQPDLAQAYAARLLWLMNPTANETRAARAAAIDAHLAARRGDAAFRAMLRYQQDYQPVDRALLAAWVEGLLALGMERDALNWLPQLDEASAAKLALRARTGVVAPDAAVAQARAAFAKSGDAGYARVLSEIGRQQAKPQLQIEGLEKMANAAAPSGRQASAQLWESYLATARRLGNEQRLLTGDDTAWADYAGRRLAAEPQLSRAVFAYLAQNAQDVQARHTARLQLVYSLHEAHLDRVALRLFHDVFPDVGALDAPTRYWLGNAAETNGQPAAALRFFQSLPAPPGTDADEWTLRLARLAVRSGAEEAPVDALKNAYAGRKSLSRTIVQGITGLAEELGDSGRVQEARTLFDVVLPYAEGMQARSILFSLGRMHEMAGERPIAADRYLRSAFLADARSPDALALEARLRAAVNLARAGYRTDARSQFQWLLTNSKQPAQRDLARRELKKLD